MKKTRPKQLTLSRQTIARLTPDTLDKVRGGHGIKSVAASVTCYTAACNPTTQH